MGDLLGHPALRGFARLMLPRDDRRYDETMRLGGIGSLLPYHSHVDPAATAAALNRMIDDVGAGGAVFHDFYTAARKREQPARANTGLFFLRCKPGSPFAIISPGGGFSYVGSAHESFPYAVAIIVEEALREEHRVRALVRDASDARQFPHAAGGCSRTGWASPPCSRWWPSRSPWRGPRRSAWARAGAGSLNAVWEVAVFVLNVLAFILVGLQLRGILGRLDGLAGRCAAVGAAVPATVILVRAI